LGLRDGMKDLVARLRQAQLDVAQRNALLDRLGAQFDALERVFDQRLGPGTVGRIRLPPGATANRALSRPTAARHFDHLVFRGGSFWIESGEPGRAPRVVELASASVEHRLRAVDAMYPLWCKCGGHPLARIPPGVAWEEK
jgi:hypothetical protein